MNVRDGLLLGRRVITERGIDLDTVIPAYRSMHPQVTSEQAVLALTIEVAAISQLSPPCTVESLAEQIADTSGAFPWNGPVGNGLTLRAYQANFREYAAERLFLARLLGFTEIGGAVDA